MRQRKKYKICLVGECLAGGGAERVQATLSYFFVKKDLCVHHVIFMDEVNYPFSGRLFNLGDVKSENPFWRKIKRFLALRNYIKNNRFDVVVDFRVKYSFWQDILISRLIYPRKTYYLIHSSNLEYYFPNAKWKAFMLYNKGKKVIGVSKGISDKIERIYRWQHIKTIYNPINTQIVDLYAKGLNNHDFEFVLAIGRMDDEVKQFDQLIDVYAQSDLPKKQIKLIILGDGKLRKKLKEYKKSIGLDDMILLEGFQNNPFVYMKKAKFLVLCSKFEGLPSVLIESLACGTPVISFACESGPSEIIQHEHNGLLVENQNFEALQQAMERMINDQSLHQKCTNNAIESVAHFSIEQVGKQWLDLLKLKRKS